MKFVSKWAPLAALLCTASACVEAPDAQHDENLPEADGADEVSEAPPSASPSDVVNSGSVEPGLAEGTACLTMYTPPEQGAEEKALVPRVVFLNRNGGTYTRGANDSSRNISSVPSATSVTLPRYEGTDTDWANLVSCVKSQYARFNVQITDQDPGAATHIEAVVGGLSSALGLGSNVGGVSPFNCGVISKSIVYVFSQAYGSVRGECEAVAHEIGHSLGLEHEYLCQDPMTYLSGCGSKTFQDTTAQCGTSSAVSCQCGSATQNTVQKLLTNVGPSTTTPTTPIDARPTVAFSAPAAGTVYARGATVTLRATASDDRAVQSVQVIWKAPTGTSTYRLNSLGNGTYGLDVRLSSYATLGTRTLTARATDDAGQTTDTAPINIEVR